MEPGRGHRGFNVPGRLTAELSKTGGHAVLDLRVVVSVSLGHDKKPTSSTGSCFVHSCDPQSQVIRVSWAELSCVSDPVLHSALLFLASTSSDMLSPHGQVAAAPVCRRGEAPFPSLLPQLEPPALHTLVPGPPRGRKYSGSAMDGLQLGLHGPHCEPAPTQSSEQACPRQMRTEAWVGVGQVVKWAQLSWESPHAPRDSG